MEYTIQTSNVIDRYKAIGMFFYEVVDGTVEKNKGQNLAVGVEENESIKIEKNNVFVNMEDIQDIEELWKSTEDIEEVEKIKQIKEEIIIKSNYDISVEEAINKQMKVRPRVEKGNTWINASASVVKEYLIPTRLTKSKYKYQFLDLSRAAGMNEEELEEYLKDKGILRGKEESYLAAANKYQINEVYLVAHSVLETGNGSSQLAQGTIYKGVKVYNMYGIKALDGSPLSKGAEYAYKMGWTSPEKAIEGGAKWISEQYINNSTYQQNTLYKMRWNPLCPGEHQYASDVAWAVKQAKKIEAIYEGFSTSSITLDLPIYN